MFLDPPHPAPSPAGEGGVSLSNRGGTVNHGGGVKGVAEEGWLTVGFGACPEPDEGLLSFAVEKKVGGCLER